MLKFGKDAKMSSTIASQAYGLIAAAEAALKSPKKGLPDAQTTALARSIATAAQQMKPGDPVLKTINFANPPDWEGILAGMRVITHTIE